MKKLKNLLELFALFAVVFSFSLSAQAAVNPDFSNATIEIENTGCVEAEDEDQPDVCSFTVSGSFDSSTDSDKQYMVILASYDFDDTLMSVSISPKYSIVEGTNTFTYDAKPIEDAKKLKAFYGQRI